MRCMVFVTQSANPLIPKWTAACGCLDGCQMRPAVWWNGGKFYVNTQISQTDMTTHQLRYSSLMSMLTGHVFMFSSIIPRQSGGTWAQRSPRLSVSIHNCALRVRNFLFKEVEIHWPVCVSAQNCTVDYATTHGPLYSGHIIPHFIAVAKRFQIIHHQRPSTGRDRCEKLCWKSHSKWAIRRVAVSGFTWLSV